MIKRFSLIVVLFIVISNIYSQQIWTNDLSNFHQKKIIDNPKTYQPLKLEKAQFLSIIQKAPNRNQQSYSSQKIALPINSNAFELFEFFESSNFSQELAAKYPSIKSFTARSLTSNAVARFSYSKSGGLHVFVNTDKGTYIVKPTDLKSNSYAAYNRKDITYSSDFECNTIEVAKKKIGLDKTRQHNLNDNFLRKYRLALAVTGEYSDYFLTGTEANDEERKTVVLSAINNTLTRINEIFERDFGVRMELIPNNDDLIYLDGDTDPFTERSRYNNELQNTLTDIIGESNYDVGHLFVKSAARNGNAGCIACVCTDGSKGSGFSAQSDLDSESFILLACHEFGHQFGGYHVQSSSMCRSAAGLQEVEPGSGSTIMSYAGLCVPKVQEYADDYFNYVNIRDVIAWTRENSSCAELIATPNTAPTVDAGIDYTIPKSTPFILTGSGDDIDNNAILSYCWEQNDPENPLSLDAPQPNWQYGPLFRSKLPTNTPTRYMPQLADVVQGNLTPTWEVVPSVSRTINFVLTVRDNALVGAKTASDQMTLTINDTAGPFLVTSQNTTENWSVGDTKTINWDVANTDQSPINTTNVEILLSIDGGYTYPYVLISSTPNNGTAEIVIPEIPVSTTQGRVMVRALDNIFYAINASDINIQTSDFSISFNDTDKSICIPNDIEYTFNYKTYLGFNETTTFSVENLPDGLTATFDPAFAINNNTPVKLTISNTANGSIGTTNFNVVGTATGILKKAAIKFNLFENTLIKPILDTPTNNSSNVDTTVDLNWNSDDNSSSYTLEVASDAGFSSIINTFVTDKSTYAINGLDFNTTYFWRVKGENICNESEYSTVFSFTTKCNTPTSITTSNITKNSVDLDWIDGTNTHLKWEVEIVPDGTTPTGSGITVLTNPSVNIPDLESSTNYNIFVRSLCSNNNYSEWVGPIKFTTLADFCSGDHFYDSGGLNGSYANNENNTTTIYASDDANQLTVTFNSFQTESCCDALYIYDGIDINAPLIGEFKGTNSPGKIISTNSAAALTFVFISDSSVTGIGWDATVECEKITCPDPINQTIANINYNEAELNWTPRGSEANWVIEFGEKGFTKGTGTTIHVDTPEYKLTSLTSNTEYDVYISANCNPEISKAETPISFKTNPNYCNGDRFYDSGGPSGSYSNNENIITTILPSDDFDQVSVTFNSFQIESCCDILYIYDGPDVTSPLIGLFRGYDSPGTITSSHSSGALTFKFVSDHSVVSYGWDATVTCETTCPKPINITVHDISKNTANISWETLGVDNDYIIEYGAKGFTPGTGTIITTDSNSHMITGLHQSTEYDAYIRTDCGNRVSKNSTPVTFKTICPKPTDIFTSNITKDTADLNWTPQGSETSWIIEYGIKGFTLGTGTVIETTTIPYSITSLNAGTEYDVYIKANCENALSETETPLSFKTICPKPIDISIDQITHNSAALSWTHEGSETSWIIEYGEKGFTLGDGTILTTNANTYKVVNLNSDTEYDVYIKTACNNGSSDTGEAFSFQTCAIFKAPFYENFIANSLPRCWYQYGSKNWIFNTGAGHEAATAGDYTPNIETNYAWVNSASSDKKDQISYLKTPLIDISDLRIPAIQFAVFSKNTTSDIYNNLQVKLYDNTGKSFHLLTMQQETINGWQVFTFNLNDYAIDANEIQLEFILTENNTTAQFYNDVLIDDVRVNNLETLNATNIPIFYPNPVKDKLVIKSHEILTKIEVFNLLRQRLKNINLSKHKSINEIDLSHLSSGIYLIKTYSKDSKPRVFKIIKN